MGLVEKVREVQQEVCQEEMQKQQEKLEKGDFTLDDFRKQFEQLEKMGDEGPDRPHARHGEMIPEGEDPEEALKRIQGMIDSMTKEERRNPDMIDIEPPPPHRRRQRRRAARGQAVPEAVRPGADADEADGADEHLGADQDGDRPGQGGAFMPGGMQIHEDSRATPATARAAKERAEERKKKNKKKKSG